MTTADKIIRLSCNTLEVRYDKVQSPSRQRELVDARHIISYLLHKHTLLSYRQIGERLGKRDHSTVINSVNRAEDMIFVKDDLFVRKLRAVQERLEVEASTNPSLRGTKQSYNDSSIT